MIHVLRSPAEKKVFEAVPKRTAREKFLASGRNDNEVIPCVISNEMRDLSRTELILKVGVGRSASG